MSKPEMIVTAILTVLYFTGIIYFIRSNRITHKTKSKKRKSQKKRNRKNGNKV